MAIMNSGGNLPVITYAFGQAYAVSDTHMDVGGATASINTIQTDIRMVEFVMPFRRKYYEDSYEALKVRGLLLPSWGPPDVINFVNMIQENEKTGVPLPLELYVKSIDLMHIAGGL